MRRLILAAAFTFLAASAGMAATWRLGALEASGAWSRPAGKGQTGSGYLSLANTGKAPAVLVAVEIPIAARVELHETVMNGQVASMRAMKDGLILPAGGKAAFAPAGAHLMLIGLKEKLELGRKFPATLVFRDGTRLKIEFTVQASDKADPMAGMAGMDHAAMGH